MNFIIVIWAFCLARLVYSIVGMVNPAMFKSGPATVALAVPSVFLGAWLGALAYNRWPEHHRTGGEYASIWRVMMCFIVSLPCFFLFWPLLVIIPISTLLLFMAISVTPCTLTLYENWRERQADDFEEFEGEDGAATPVAPKLEVTSQQHVIRELQGWWRQNEFAS